ncbi:MAG TPA: DUF4038 domain-containing protein [Steroidobacteraceae bacterium]|nr:DUF4038 domain-containing protein [Steroidobacteraceae bacterium]
MKEKALIALVTLLLGACGGGGTGAQTPSGSGSPPETPAPTPPVTPSAPVTSVLFPLHAEAQRRYLQAANGEPFFLQGDAAWSLIARLTREQIVEYLDDRQRRGFNTVLVSLIEHKFTDHPPNNAYGEPPFLTSGDFSTPNERYFEHAEFALVEAEKRGIVVLLAPAYMGFQGGDEGWYQEMVRQGSWRLHEYGRYLAHRFANRKNVVWVHGGDFNPPESELFKAVAEGIIDVAPDSLHTFHGGRNSSALGVATPTPSWLRLNNIYTSGDNVVPSALTEFARAPVPFFLIEALYELNGVDAAGVRREAYQASLSGACGQIMGHNTVWQFSAGWREALDSTGARTIGHLKELLTLAHWPDLEPDATLLVSGAGSGELQAAVVRSADRHTGLVYVPARRGITVNLDQFAGRVVHARWFSPATGALDEMPGSPWARTGQKAVTPPVDPAATDWVAVFESSN